MERDLPLGREWVNPYRSRISEFPGRIFLFRDRKKDAELVRKRCAQVKKVYVELGSGSGMHLIEFAKSEPNALCLGFELRYKRTVRTIEKVQKYGVENLIMLHLDAKFLDEVFSPESIDGFFINFPDPWAKKKQLKHRLMQKEFIQILCSFLKPSGFISFKTDHAEYFHSTICLCKNIKEIKIQRLSEDALNSQWWEELLPTEFQSMFLSQGLPIYYALLQKVY